MKFENEKQRHEQKKMFSCFLVNYFIGLHDYYVIELMKIMKFLKTR